MRAISLCASVLMLVGRFSTLAADEDERHLRELLPKTPAWSASAAGFPERAELMATVKSLGSNSIDVLTGILLNKEEDEKRRCGAAWVLAELNDKRAIAALVKALGDERLSVEDAASQAIGRIDAPEVVPVLVSQFLAGNEEGNAAAGVTLGRLQRPTYAPALILLLKHKEHKVRFRAVEGLGNIGEKSATSYLIAALDDENEGVVMYAAQSLGKIGDAAALDPLREHLRKGLAAGSGGFDDLVFRTHLNRAIEAIQKKQGEGWAREQEIPDGAAGLTTLIQALKAKEANTRQNATVELKKRGIEAAPAAVALTGLLGDPDERVRVGALDALVAIGPAAIKPTVQTLLNGSPVAQDKACGVLLRLFAGGEEKPIAVDPDTVKAIASMLDHKDPNFRANIMMVLGLLEGGAAPAATALADKLGDTGGWVAAIALAGIGEAAVPELVNALKAKQKEVRRLAAYALGQMGVPSKIVFSMMISGAWGFSSVEEMDRFRCRESAVGAVPALAKALGDKEPTVAAQAAQALGRMGSHAKAAIPALEAAANGGATEVRPAAFEALKRIKQVVPREENLPHQSPTSPRKVKGGGREINRFAATCTDPDGAGVGNRVNP